MFCFIDVLEILLVSTVFAVFVCVLVVIISVNVIYRSQEHPKL